MSENENLMEEPRKSSGKGGYIIAILILLLLLGGAAYLWSDARSQKDECVKTNQELSSELEAAYAVFNANGDQNKVIDDLAAEMQNVFIQFENMEMANVEMSDSIQHQQDRLKTMMAELESERKSKKRNARKIVELKQEIETMRDVMRHYVHVIDSLGQVNQQLSSDLNRTTNQLTRTSDSLRGARQDIEYLSGQMNEAEKLSAVNFSTTALRITSSGSQKETNRAKRANAIKSCFTLAKNPVTKAGEKRLYMVVKDPSGNVLYRTASSAFQTEQGNNMVYSDVKVIKYANETLDVCVFYEHNGEFDGGDYTVEIWADGVKIGSDKLGLK